LKAILSKVECETQI